MKTRIPKLSKTVRKDLEIFKRRILKLPCTKELSSLVGCVDYFLERTAGNETTNS